MCIRDSLRGLQHATGDWALGMEKAGDVLEGIMGRAEIIHTRDGPLAPGTFWHDARRDVEIAALGVCNRVEMAPPGADPQIMAPQILRYHLYDNVTIVRHPSEVAANLVPWRRHQSVREVHLQVNLLIVGRDRIFVNDGEMRKKYMMLKYLITRFLVAETV